MVSLKNSGFPWNHTRYQRFDDRFEFLDVENPSVNTYGKSMVSLKTSGFPWNHTRYQRSDLRFEFLDVENPSVNPYGKFMVSLKIDAFLTFADTPAINQSNKQFILARLFSTRKRIIS